MLKPLYLSAAVVMSLATQLAFPVVAAPQEQQASKPNEVYIGVFSFDESDIRDVYVVLNSIKVRGDLRRFQVRDIYQQDQFDELGKYKYRQTLGYWVANCREGSIDVQKVDYFDVNGSKSGEFLMELNLKVPQPESINEKKLDLVCDYQI